MDSYVNNRYAVILAGGRGERFWPLSRQNSPKQLLKLFNGKSLLQLSVERARLIAPKENILVITSVSQLSAVKAQLKGLPTANIIAEPIGRDTCPAIALGAAIVGSRNPQAVMAVFPADHLIETKDGLFKKIINAAIVEAAHSDKLITIGISPTGPATGYGYIKTGERHGAFFVGEKFVEKPDLKTAERYLASGKYLWNAGMFIWSVATFATQLKAHFPKMHASYAKWQKVAISPTALAKTLSKEYPAVEKISIDYALMEKSKKILCAAGKFEWDDLGSHPAYGKHLPSDKDNNRSQADAVYVDASGNIVCDARKKKALTALVGVHDMVVVHTDDATLIASKHKPGQLKELLQMLSSDGRYKRLL